MVLCADPYICPLCTQPLSLHGRSFQCAQRHTFDVAREGYVNLLTGKRPLTLGDDAAMIRARRAFLDGGWYAPLARHLGEVLAELRQDWPETAVSLLDVGCGEGYYVGHLAQWVSAPLCTYGLDVAKTAVQLAARRYRDTRFVVADVWQRLPFATASLHLLVSLFAPRHPAEFGRCLRPGGYALIGIPTPAHLADLRQTFGLLDIQAEKSHHLQRQMADWFQLHHSTSLEFPLRLDAPHLTQLVAMTPNARHITTEQRQRMGETAVFHTQASISFRIFRRL